MNDIITTATTFTYNEDSLLLIFIISGLTLHSWLFIEKNFSALQTQNGIATTNNF